jgi:hypothetical protein
MSDPSVNILSRFIKALLHGILDSTGQDGVRSIFVGGSIAAGEVARRYNGSRVEFYSDVDLYIVLDDEADVGLLRNRFAAVVARLPLEDSDFVFYRAPDVGVYTFEGLAGQPARPGTVGLETRHMMLYGDSSIPGKAALRIGNDIALEESFYLLENRLLELSLPGVKNTDEGYRSYVACKMCLDAAAATLIAKGLYTTGRTESVRKLFGLGMDRDIGWSDEQLALVNRCDTALRRMPDTDWNRTVPAEQTLAAAAALSLDVWKNIASDTGGDWSSTLLRRCRTGEYLRNFRQFRAINSRCGFRRRGGLLSGAGLARYSPVDALRMSALIEYLYRDKQNRPEINGVVQSVAPYLDKLTRLCGFEDGSLVERSNRMYRSL